ncbi:unnamed protein product [Spirodela intermedia]|uniref:Serine aminopeptidase S33 domain-containing protein n=1 Tax=Spirodela intermedia TaxID=51605 RepID=A0A7I8J826_SPIIN|nr:unnamed protein product [Spirodela intermedia]CAA6666337.1 unnamed protein product [Spirodela intermedia]
MPEDEYYASQGVRNRQSYFTTPQGHRLFTQSFEPVGADGKLLPVKASVYMTHGYGSDSGWLFQKIAISYARWGYTVFCADLLGHGRSDGIRCYLGDMEGVAAASLSFFLHTRRSKPFEDLPAFLFGESMGGAATMLMYFQSKDLPGGCPWTGLIFSAPLFVMPEDMKPSDNKMVGKAIKDREKLKIIASNPRRYTGKPRVGTMRELARVCEYIQSRFADVELPFLTVHGTDDGVTSPRELVPPVRAGEQHRQSVRLYEGMYHSLIQGEPEEKQQPRPGRHARLD